MRTGTGKSAKPSRFGLDELKGCRILIPRPAGSLRAGNDKDEGGAGDDRDVVRFIKRLGGAVVFARDTPAARAGGKRTGATHEFVPEGAGPTTGLPVLAEADLRSRAAAATNEVVDFLRTHARPAFVPEVAGTPSPGAESRYFGDPWMPDGMAWPLHNGKPMRFVLQLDTASLPEVPAAALVGKGLLLFFHGEGWSEDGRESLVALVDPTLPGGLRPPPKGVAENPALAITGWREVADHPWGDSLATIPGGEHAEAALYHFHSETVGMAMCEDGGERREREIVEGRLRPIAHCFECDKIGGWPRWEQGDETPKDSRDKPMEFLFQVGYCGLLLDDAFRDRIDWPTWGRGHIFVSRETGELRYIWACD